MKIMQKLKFHVIILMYKGDENKMTKETPCDWGDCPYNAMYSEDCRYYCGLGVDEDSYPDEEEEESI